MKSPFPGFDPYLEESWGDVHQTLAIYARNAIQPQLPADLRARTEERVYVEYEGTARRVIVPDVGVLERRQRGGERAVSASGSGPVAILEPMTVLVSDPVTESYVEIREKGDGKLITVIEFISPSNKLPGPGREKYRQKQRELEAADGHLVEIDLVRAGERVFDFPGPIGEQCASMLMAHIRKGYEHRLYAFSLRERLPVLPVPLRYEEPEIVLDLQPLHDQCYRDGAYDDIDYSRDPALPIDPENAAWLDALLRTAGHRD